MKKHYSVVITAFVNVGVICEDGQDAASIACAEVDYGDFQMDEGGPAKEIAEGDVASYLRHADKIIEQSK